MTTKNKTWLGRRGGGGWLHAWALPLLGNNRKKLLFVTPELLLTQVLVRW